MTCFLAFALSNFLPSVTSAQIASAPAPTLTASVDALPSAPSPSADALERAADTLTLNQQTSSSSSTTQTSTRAQQSQPSTQQQQQQQPSLSDLGLSSSQTAPDPALQARLDRHTQMLKIHQRLGLITLIPMAAAVISSGGATGGHNLTTTGTTTGNTTGRDIHAALGAITVGMYGATAYYAIRAPKVSEGPSRGGIRLHKYLIFVHAPGMVLTPILGAMAFNQLNNGQKVHGIASAHAAVAWTTVLSYSAAMVAVSWPIHL